jgi:hypothetical protein
MVSCFRNSVDGCYGLNVCILMKFTCWYSCCQGTAWGSRAFGSAIDWILDATHRPLLLLGLWKLDEVRIRWRNFSHWGLALEESIVILIPSFFSLLPLHHDWLTSSNSPPTILCCLTTGNGAKLSWSDTSEIQSKQHFPFINVVNILGIQCNSGNLIRRWGGNEGSTIKIRLEPV